jgi:hypothetical protein
MPGYEQTRHKPAFKKETKQSFNPFFPFKQRSLTAAVHKLGVSLLINAEAVKNIGLIHSIAL